MPHFTSRLKVSNFFQCTNAGKFVDMVSLSSNVRSSSYTYIICSTFYNIPLCSFIFEFTKNRAQNVNVQLVMSITRLYIINPKGRNVSKMFAHEWVGKNLWHLMHFLDFVCIPQMYCHTNFCQNLDWMNQRTIARIIDGHIW